MQVTNNLLQKHIDNGKIAPSYLLIDKDLLKLRKIADWFSDILKIKSADVFWLTPEPDADTIQVKGTEKFIERANLAAVGERKLLVVCDASSMTISAQNKLLKTVEDAAARTHFLLLASQEETVLNTIKSRCVLVYPEPLTTHQVLSVFPALPIDFCDRTLSGAEQFLNNPNAPSIYRNVEQLLTSTRTLDDALTLIPLLGSKDNFKLTLKAFDFYLNKMLHSPEPRHWTITRINDIIRQLSIVNRNAEANCNTQNAFDLLLIELFKEEGRG